MQTTSNSSQYQKKRHQFFEKNLVPGPKGPIDKSKKIMEKNAAKGQNSLSKYLGAQNYNGVVSNTAAFNHYAVQSNTYASQGPTNVKPPESESEEEQPPPQ